jgi:hypothetical protein
MTRVEWLPQAAPAIERPAELPASVAITSARSRLDPGPAHWKRLSSGENLAQAGIYDSHFIFYRAKIVTAGRTNLLVGFRDGDGVLAMINGRPSPSLGGTAGSALFPLDAGANAVNLLYENHGHDNGGAAMAASDGIFSTQLAASLYTAGKLLDGWRMHDVQGTSKRPEVRPDFDDSGWPSVSVAEAEPNQLAPGQTVVFRTSVEVAADDLTGGRMILTLGCVDDLGWIYVNGKSVGTTTDWSRAYSFDVTGQLHPGRNVIAVIVKNIGGNGGLGAPVLGHQTKGAAVPLESFGRPTGDEQQWWMPELADTDWQQVNLGEAPAASNNDPLLTWYRMNFRLPAPQSGVWVPWHLHLLAHGNGFLYLNGHAIGRYWDIGPQHDFFLPECWLNQGNGQTNNITLNLQPTGNGADIQSAVVEPYAAFAEKR